MNGYLLRKRKEKKHFPSSQSHSLFDALPLFTLQIHQNKSSQFTTGFIMLINTLINPTVDPQSSSYLTFQQLLIMLTTPSLLKYSFNWLPRHNALLVFLLLLWPLLLAITFADILYFTWPLNIRVPQGLVPAPLFFSLYGFFTPWIRSYTNTQINLEVIFLD